MITFNFIFFIMIMITVILNVNICKLSGLQHESTIYIYIGLLNIYGNIFRP